MKVKALFLIFITLFTKPIPPQVANSLTTGAIVGTISGVGAGLALGGTHTFCTEIIAPGVNKMLPKATSEEEQKSVDKLKYYGNIGLLLFLAIETFGCNTLSTQLVQSVASQEGAGPYNRDLLTHTAFTASAVAWYATVKYLVPALVNSDYNKKSLFSATKETVFTTIELHKKL